MISKWRKCWNRLLRTEYFGHVNTTEKILVEMLPLSKKVVPTAVSRRYKSCLLLAVGMTTFIGGASASFRSAGQFKIKGVIFDMDGTLTEYGSIDFAAMYSRNGLKRRHGSDILTLVNNLPTEAERAAAMQIILEEEQLGIERMVLRPHLHSLLDHIDNLSLRVALTTRNCEYAYTKFIERANLPHTKFFPALHRDSLGGINKPDPAVARHILDHWEIKPGEEKHVWFVGDSVDDMLCGRQAGCHTCLIKTPANTALIKSNPDLVDIVVEDLLHLKDCIAKHTS